MIPQELASKILREALKTGADLAEIYVEDVTTLQLGLDNTRLEKALRGGDRGAGIRIFFGNLVTYAYTDNLDEASLMAAAQAAAAAGTGSARSQTIDLTERKSPLVFPIEKAFDTLSIEDKARLLHEINDTARSVSGYVKQVSANYSEIRRQVWIFNSDGLYVSDDRNFVEMSMNVTAGRDGKLQQASEGFGAQSGLELLDRFDPIALSREAAETAVRLLDARPCPAGEMTVVLPPGWGGVLFHEACGHQMEADFVTTGSSAYANKVGELVASPLVTAIDDGTIPGRRGSLRFDDDGTPSQRTVLIEKGVLKEYMWDLVQARRAGRSASTGNGRRESYRHTPMPRMTNTFIDNGEHDPQEIIENTQSGIFVKSMSGGQANISRGDFVFNAKEAYLIENGKITAPVGGATMAGHGPTVLREIDMIGNDLALDPGRGHCGKMQTAKVSVGQPTVRLPKVMVGGTN